MRTIKENLFQRLAAQASEAELQGLAKVAESLTDQLEKLSIHVRPNDEKYSYSREDFLKDVHSQLWGAILRMADFYDIRRLDAAEVQEIIEKKAQDMIDEIKVLAGVQHGVGAWEDPVPGEEKATIEIEEE